MIGAFLFWSRFYDSGGFRKKALGVIGEFAGVKTHYRTY